MSNRRRPNPEPGPAWRTGLSDQDNLALAQYVAATTTCPDCNSEATVESDGPLIHIRFAHDDGCPWLSGVTR